jgi:hypothetical protein
MRRIKSTSTGLAAAALALACASSESAAAADSVVASTWQHHKVTFPYIGLTSKFNCNGLADTVRAILLHLGARDDVHVWASGCGAGSSVPGGNAFVETDFYALSPAANGDSSDSVPAQWTAKVLDRNHPHIMDYGSCELIDQMRDLITTSFAMRDLQYRADCFPHGLNINGFLVRGKALTAVAPAKS